MTTWITDRLVTFIRNAERISGCGYEIITDRVRVQQDGDDYEAYRATAFVMGKPLGTEVYMPEGACGIRTATTDRLRISCIRALADLVRSQLSPCLALLAVVAGFLLA